MFIMQGMTMVWALILALLLLFVLPRSAWAYIDPGTGSLIWQLLLASALTAAFLAKRYWRKIRQLLHIGVAPKTEDNGENPSE
jgi:hypothetical protein